MSDVKLLLIKARESEFHLELANESLRLACIESILSISTSERSEFDIKILTKLTSNFKFFKKIIQSEYED